MPRPRPLCSSLKSLPIIVGAAIALVAATACDDNKTERVADIKDPDSTPTMVTTDVETFISDSGYTRFHITAPIWYMYEEASNPRWTFPKGLFLEKYDNNFRQEATVTCDSATYFSQQKLWRLDGNVRMRNARGDRFLTRQLFWDQAAREVYSDSFIHIERVDRVIEGVGFRSNDEMTDYIIHNPTGIFPVDAFTDHGGSDDTLATQGGNGIPRQRPNHALYN